MHWHVKITKGNDGIFSTLRKMSVRPRIGKRGRVVTFKMKAQ